MCGGPTVPRLSRHYFFRLSEFSGRLASWVHGGSLQPQVEQWVDARLREGLDDWCISRDGPYFGFPVPGELKKFFCVWLDAPLGYLSGPAGRGGRPLWDDPTSDVVQFVRRDIIAFHTLFWPAMLMGADFSLPGRITVQGYLNVDGWRVAGRYGPCIEVRSVAERTDPECLRYVLASRMGDGLEEIDVSPARVTGSLSEELSGQIVGFLRRSFTAPVGGQGGEVSEGMVRRYAAVGRAYAAIDCRRALALVRELARDIEPGPAVGRDLAILLDPVLPRLTEEVRLLAGATRPWSWVDLGQPFNWRGSASAGALAGRLDCRRLGGLLSESAESQAAGIRPTNCAGP
jgi:methionyl-tRNA synthetase